MIPYFIPGKEEDAWRNDNLMDLDHTRTWYMSKDGLSLLNQ